MTVFFTICAKNFLAQALTLHQALRRTHGAIAFYLVVCDSTADFDVLALPFPIIGLGELGIPELDSMQQQYNITELNTALKPFAFQYIFDQHPGARVVYLDPDIFVTSALSEVEEAFDSGANCILTPHVIEPAEFAEFDDQKFLQYGVFNLGFCALKDTPQVRRVVSWWGRRLQKQCTIDLPNGIFVDQKWVDLFPAYIDHTVVLRHYGYNVGYWNLSQRRIRFQEGKWMANDRELRFAHFSGAVIGSATTFSRHSKAFTRKNIGDLRLLLEQYENQVAANGHAHFSQLPYAFSWNGAKGENLHTPENAGTSELPSKKKIEEHPCWLPLSRETSFLDHLELSRNLSELKGARRQFERDIIKGVHEPFFVRGYCSLCRSNVHFQCGFMYATKRAEDGTLLPNWRENLDCSQCKLGNRVRASLHIFLQEFRPDRFASIYMTEQVTPAYTWIRERFPNTQGSDYFVGRRPGEIVDGIRNEDIQSLSFRSETFDYILSFDVLEHVPFEQKAFRELFRCLKPGGKLLFTAPFLPEIRTNTVRAVLESNGQIRHLVEPEYHGNPVDPERGALAFRYFGWECLDQLAAAGFRSPTALGFWSRQLGHLGDDLYVFAAEKPAARIN